MVTKRRTNIDILYEKHKSIDHDVCYYCNHFANTIDHIPPLNLVRFYCKFPKILVKACWSCNSILSDKFLPNLLSRVEFLIKKYKKKYNKTINLPDWDKDEINALKGSLKKYVSDEITKKEVAIERIEYLNKKYEELLQGTI